MAELNIRGVSKSFGEKRILNRVDFTAKSGEFVALLGPSGCGKTTLLNIISGIIKQDEGVVEIDGRDVSSLKTERRNIGVVFQNYALFEHMNVGQNLAYGLKIRKTPKEEIRRRVAETLALVRLEGMEKRAVAAMSGGEQQRVALGRAIIMKPDILLLDEPLSALDKKIREQMQIEIRRIQRETGITTVFVTHDQGEAITMADKIAIMKDGEIIDQGGPKEIYMEPKTLFSADFLGATNLLRGRYCKERQAVVQGEAAFFVGERNFADGQQMVAAVKEEHLRPGDKGIPGKIKGKVFLGQLVRLYVETDFGTLTTVDMERDWGEVPEGEQISLYGERFTCFAEEE